MHQTLIEVPCVLRDHKSLKEVIKVCFWCISTTLALNKSRGMSLRKIRANTMSSVIVDTKGLIMTLTCICEELGDRWNKPKLDVMIFEYSISKED